MRYKVPPDVQATARSGLEQYSKSKKPGLDVALHVASVLSSGEAGSKDLQKIFRYYPKSNDSLATSLWGGSTAKDWASVILSSSPTFSVSTFSDSSSPTVRVSEFSLNTDKSYVDGDYKIYPDSYLFEVGNFKDKNLEVTREDLAERVKNSTPVFANIEHYDLDPTDKEVGAFAALDGQLGYIAKFWIDSDNPDVARGEIHVPLFLDNNLTSKGISMEVPTAPGEGFSAFAYTYSPRIRSATLMSSVMVDFKKSKSYTTHGLRHASDLHNTLVNMGAVCTGGTASMSSSHEQKIAQGMHDQLISEGMATCTTIPEDKLADTRANVSSYYYSKGKTSMPKFTGLKSLIPAWFTAGQPDEFEIPVKDESGTILTIVPVVDPPVEKKEEVVDFKDTPEYAQFTKELEAAKTRAKELEDEKTANFATSNAAAIEALKADDKILPEQVESLVAWRAKDPASFDAHFANMPKLGNITVTVDAEEVANKRNKTASLTGPNPEDVMKEVLAMAKAREK